MNPKVKLLIPLLIPAITLWLVIQFNDARGPYYLNVNSDPAYLYLINSLNIATGHSVAHVDNPGTTVQIIGGITIKTATLFNGVKDAQRDVLLHPEYYLELINKVLLAFCLITLWFMGMIGLKIAGGIWVVLLLQSVPFTSWQVMKAFTKVSPEPLSVLFAMLLVTILLVICYKDDLRDRTGKYVVLFAVVCGAGLITKLTFFPLLVIPLFIIPSTKWKAIFVLTTALVFAVLFIPGYPYFRYLYEWTRDILVHSGHYGGGPSDFLNPRTFLQNLTQLVVLYHTYFVLLAVTGGLILKVGLRKTERSGIHYRVLLATFAASICHVLMVAKHYHPHYMLPVLVIIPLMIYLSYRVLPGLGQDRFLSSFRGNLLMVGMMALVLVLLILRHNAGSMVGQSVFDWFFNVLSANTTYFLSIVTVTLVLLALIFFQNVPKLSLPIAIMLIVVIGAYQIRHIDLWGFKTRSLQAKDRGLAVMDFVENKNPGTLAILGDKSSSKYYALKYGSFFNFQQPHHFQMLKELYGKQEIFFWGLEYKPRKFYTWTRETDLDRIFIKNPNVILQGDTNGLTSGNVDFIEKYDNVQLVKKFGGSLESVYKIQKD